MINTGMGIKSASSTTTPKPKANTAANEAALIGRTLGDPFYNDVVAHLKMDGSDEGTTFTDSSSNTHTFTDTGGAVTDTDIVNYGTASLKCIAGLDTNISSSTVTITDDSTDFTMEAWVYIIGDSYFGSSRSEGLHVIFSEEKNSSNSNQIFYVADNGSVAFFQGSGIAGSNVSTGTAASLVSLNTWTHIALCYDDAAQLMMIFVDGIRSSRVTWTTGGWKSQVRDFVIGSSSLPSYQVWRLQMNGYVDDWRVTEVCRYRESFTPPASQHPDNVGTSPWALTAGGRPSTDPDFSSVTLLLPVDGTDAATTAPDLSNENHTLTFTNNAQLDTAQFKYGSASALFDGTSDYISIPDDISLQPGSSSMTVECHVRFNGDPGTGQHTFVSKWNNGGANRKEWWVGYRNNELNCFLSSSGSNGIFLIDEAWDPAGDTWYHIAWVIDRDLVTDACRIFVDGVQIGSDDTTLDTYPAFWNSISDVWIGGYDDDTNDWMDGWIDNVRITKGVVRYTGNFDPPTKAYPTE